MDLRPISLSDRFIAERGETLMTGTQTLLVAMLRQRRFDRARGLDTAGFLSGYRGSPIASLDTEAQRAAKHLAAHQVTFVPGINEDLALTAVWGSQQVALDPNATVSGVFGMWYGKGAGLDRCGDVLRHAHGAGASRQGGVLVVAGDDHALKSSSQAYHCEPMFVDMMMPVLAPADLQDMLDLSILGWEMSRFSGAYVGFKVLAEHVNSTGIVDVGLERIALADLKAPTANERWIRWPDPWPDVERRHLEAKLPAALHFARANDLNPVVSQATMPKLGIIASGKSFRDVLEALRLADLDLGSAAKLGISVKKIGMPWPVDADGLRGFCKDHPTVLVIEEKRAMIEDQVRAALYGTAAPPLVVGHYDHAGVLQLPFVGEISALQILAAIANAIALPEAIAARVETLVRRQAPARPVLPPRAPYFCSGCPHSRSTKVPEGSRALAGVGCHFMAIGMDRNTETFTQMGGEGAPWIGTAPFTETDHVFVNMGEGTYYHSGILAIRAAQAAGVNITFKILFNDAIAMTGGQAVEGELTVPIIAAQLRAEGVAHIEVVTDDPSRTGDLPSVIGVHDRAELDAVQRTLRERPGVSALIYDQVCATELRRRRKRGTAADAPRRVVINEQVCEACGDCSVASNCLSVVPIKTTLGTKRAIDQWSCNQDASCLDGFCPSFVTVEGAELRKDPVRPVPDLSELPEPPPARVDGILNIVIAGVGGTGIVTVGALLAMAAHLEGKQVCLHDKLGMAQKYGAVHTHLRLSTDAPIPTVRIPDGAATLLIGGDLRCAAEAPVTRLLDRERAHIIAATEQAVGGEFTRERDFDFREPELTKALRSLGEAHLLPVRKLATDFLGDEIGANLILVGYVWQKGLLPLSLAAIDRAIALNGVAVDLNRQAFALGRYAAQHPDALREAKPAPMTLDALVEHRTTLLSAWQDQRWAQRYRAKVAKVVAAETTLSGGPGPWSWAVAWNLAKLMTYKDEYEVARLYTDGTFARTLKRTFANGGKLSFYLAPPMLERIDPATGRPIKRRFGAWVLPLFSILARLKRLRGTPFDPFGRHPDRKEERALIVQYEDDLDTMIAGASAADLPRAIELARLPEEIRGYGPIKSASVRAAQARRREILSQPTQAPQLMAAQ